MTTVGFCPSVREAWKRATELCFPRRSAWGLKAALLLMHLVIVGVLFLFDTYLIQKTREEPWYTSIYLVLFAATLFQYFFTSSSSPGYVVDAMKAWNEAHATFTQTPRTSKQTASSKDGSLVCPMVVPQLERSISGMNSSPWVKQVMNLYPLGLSRSLHGQSIAMTVTNVFFSLIIIVFGLERVSVKETIADFGGTFLKKAY
ncbi:protein S-acyltransferase 10 [Cinnamomum micranthum f. kanehirae]|uniref:Protein S-acyltransferase 10 n=1 Tax=Cinnamomum micranthum f. kanehirae TaxID=337451 RepID=A0A3S3PK55_9MAGN|nr:protein S-acyltransferase 10 [Cinnamomum micranthum f. kanehirae]